MGQSNQEIIQKPSLPTKTKIAIWWIRIFFILIFLRVSLMFLLGWGIKFSPWLAAFLMHTIIPFFDTLLDSWPWWANIILMLIQVLASLLICPLFLLFLFSFFAARRKKWAWITLVILHFLIIIPIIFSNFLILLAAGTGGAYVDISFWLPVILFWDLFILIPLILLLLDRKNFFKIAS